MTGAGCIAAFQTFGLRRLLVSFKLLLCVPEKEANFLFSSLFREVRFLTESHFLL